MRILIDIDDTIWDLFGSTIKYLNNKFNLKLDETEFSDWDDLINQIPNYINEADFWHIYYDTNFWNTVEVFEDAYKYIQKFIEDGNEIYLISATDPDTISVKYNVLIKKFPMLSKDNFIFIFNKQLVQGDYLVDDNIINLVNGPYEPILIAAKTNKHLIVPNYIDKFNSWKEIYNYISL